jgi:hypothetical protein
MSTVEIESEIKRERERERDTEYRGIGRVSVKAVLWLLIAGPVSVSPRRVSAWHSASMVLAAGVRLSERQPASPPARQPASQETICQFL